MTWYNQCTKLSSSALELMILHCTILFPPIELPSFSYLVMPWACCFHCGMVMNTYPLEKGTECNGGIFFLTCQQASFLTPCLLFCEVTRTKDRSQNQNVNGTNLTVPDASIQDIFLVVSALSQGPFPCLFALLLQHCTLESLHSKPGCLKLSFLPACCLTPGARFTSACVKPTQGNSMS